MVENQYNGQSSGKKPKKIWVFAIQILLIVFILAVLSTSFYIVDGRENSVVTRFGKYKGVYGPGLHFKLPFGIEKNYNVPTKTIQEAQFGFKFVKRGNTTESVPVKEESTMLTGDLNLVEVEWTMQYQIVDPKAYLFAVEDTEKTIRDVSRSVINSLVGDRPILAVIGSERKTIQDEAPVMMNETYNLLGMGISVKAVNLQNVVAPEGVQDAFEDVNKADQDMQRLINEGKDAYNGEIPRIKGEAEKIIEVAKGYAQERINRANGDVARFNAVYQEYVKNPKVTRDRLYLEAMEEVLKETGETIIIDSKLDNFLPVKNLGTGN